MSERDAIEIIASDRIAAANLEKWERDDTKRFRFLNGDFDETFAVQAFARHRATHAAEVERLREALRPFVTFAETFVGDDGWVGPMNKERIVDWFGPSDFSIARQAMIDTSPIDTYEMEPIDTSFGVGDNSA